ncbi:MAG: hypothetical protein ABIH88_01080 [Patescibacteria group bacterium]|nr:hypothetical protein [Patescibacteria group bacterium]
MRFLVKNEIGQGLLEVVIAIAVMIIIATALVGVVAKSIDNSTFSRNKAKASSLAQKSMEEARDLRDQNQAEFFTEYYASNTCTATITSGMFTIVRDCSYDGDETVALEIIASWTDNKGEHETKINTQLTNWR